MKGVKGFKEFSILAILVLAATVFLAAPVWADCYTFDDMSPGPNTDLGYFSQVDQDFYPANSPYADWMYTNVYATTQATADLYGWKGISGIGLIGGIEGEEGSIFQINFPSEITCANFSVATAPGLEYMEILVNGTSYSIGPEPQTLWVQNFDNLTICAPDWFTLDNFCTPCSVPIPPTVWLFGVGSLGLVGFRRLRKNT